jgi:hypothetical protein
MGCAFRGWGLLCRRLGHRPRPFLLLAAILGPLVQGCSLVTSFDGYTGGQAVTGDAHPDAVPQEDGGADDRSTPSDGTGGEEGSAGPQSDAGADAESVPDSEWADIRVEPPSDSSETDSATTPDTGTAVDASEDSGASGDAQEDAGMEAGTKAPSGNYGTGRAWKPNGNAG